MYTMIRDFRVKDFVTGETCCAILTTGFKFEKDYCSKGMPV